MEARPLIQESQEESTEAVESGTLKNHYTGGDTLSPLGNPQA